MARAYKQYKMLRHVEDIMSCDVVTIGPNASMAEAAVLMGDKHIGSLIVVIEGTPAGIITERDLLSGVLAKGKDPATIKVGEVMSSPLITVDARATIKQAAQAMMVKKGRLAVYQRRDGKERLVGIITAADLIKSLPESEDTLMSIDDVMTRRLVTADAATSVGAVATTMGAKRIGSVVVTRDGTPYGIFTERDLLTHILARGRSLDTAVGEAASSPLVTIPTGSTIHETAATMTVNQVRRLPVVEDGAFVGIVTARDLVEAYSK
jgi:CBS domain-containing protein